MEKKCKIIALFWMFVCIMFFACNQRVEAKTAGEYELVYKENNNYYTVTKLGNEEFKEVNRNKELFIKTYCDIEIAYGVSIYMYVQNGSTMIIDQYSLKWDDMKTDYYWSDMYAYYPVSSVMKKIKEYNIVYFEIILANGQTFKYADLYTSNAFYLKVLGDYVISFNSNGGKNGPSWQTKDYGQSLVLSNVKPVREGYIFLGWALKSTATSPVYSSGGIYIGNSSVTLYAVWKPEEYTISYNSNGGIGAPSSQKKYFGTTLVLSNTIPTREEYTFLGWALNSLATNPDYNSGEIYTSNSAAILYAVWKKNDIVKTNQGETISQNKISKKGILKSVKSPNRRTIKITWKKMNGVTGYHIYISRKIDFSRQTYQRYIKRKKSVASLVGLKSKKIYYVKMRPYKKVGKKIYYGIWSKVKRVKIH